jgi:hypothetical protein
MEMAKTMVIWAARRLGKLDTARKASTNTGLFSSISTILSLSDGAERAQLLHLLLVLVAVLDTSVSALLLTVGGKTSVLQDLPGHTALISISQICISNDRHTCSFVVSFLRLLQRCLLRLDLFIKIIVLIFCVALSPLNISIVPVSIVKVGAVILWLSHTLLVSLSTILVWDIRITLIFSISLLLFLSN